MRRCRRPGPCRLWRLALIILCLLLSAGAVADRRGGGQDVSLVLSGGGALGYAHIGVLEVLEEMRVPVGCVVGTSMGAMVGGAYAAGVRPAQMREILDRTDVLALFDDQPPRTDVAQRVKRDDHRPLFGFTLGLDADGLSLPAGASAGYKFEFFIKTLVGSGAARAGLEFDRLPTPFRAVATDLETGEMKVFAKGELSRVMRASMSLPALVAPSEIEGRIYVDGGMVRNLPVDVGRGLCGDTIVAVNLGTKPSSREFLHSSLDVAKQSILILTEQNVRQSLDQLNPRDVLIAPDLEGFSSADFSLHAPIIERGRNAALAQSRALASLSVSDSDYQHWLQQREAAVLPPLRVRRIVAESAGPISEQAILRDVNVESGGDFDTRELNLDLERTFGRGDFSYVGYSTVPLGDEAEILIKAEAKPWGPGYFKFGLGAATDFDSPSQLAVAASYRRTWLNALGAEWRTDLQLGYDSVLATELLQPLQVRDGAFVALVAGIQHSPVEIYQKETRIGNFKVDRAWASLDIGVTGPLGELRFGPYIEHLKSEPGLGVISPIISTQRVDRAGLVLRGVLDQLDSAAFPREGLLINGEIAAAAEDWGADDDLVRAKVGMSAATSLGENTLFARLEWGDIISGEDLSVYDAFQLGGPRRLSGLYLDQLTGTRFGLASLSYYYRFTSLPSQLGRGLYWGLSLEAGRINDPLMDGPWDWVTSGSAFWAADTLFGPAYVGYGYSSLGQGTVYLTIGPHF
jgi:NTE family protein